MRRYLGSAEERGSAREAAAGGEGHSLLQELLQLRRAGLGLRLCQGFPQPAGWGARYSGTRGIPDPLLLAPSTFRAPGGIFCGEKAKSYLFLNSRKGSWWYCPQSWCAFSRKGNSSASIRLR